MTNTKFELITWSSTFSCGVKVIDDQHKGLIDLVNDLFSHSTGNDVQERNYFDLVIQDLVKYVKNHFSTEEKLMSATKFPGYIEHKKEHEAFILKVVKTVKDYKEGKRYTLASISRFLKDWVLSHIAVMDKKYFEYFKKVASRKADGRLSITSDDVALFNM